MKLISPLLLLVLLSGAPAFGRLAEVATFEELAEQADVVVIATPMESMGVDVVLPFPGYSFREKDGTQTPRVGAGIWTNFRILATFKGELPGTEFHLQHLEEIPSTSARRRIVQQLNAPSTLKLEMGRGKAYLMFLKKEEGYFSPVSGYTDPGNSIMQLRDSDAHVAASQILKSLP